MKKLADYTLGLLIVLVHFTMISWQERHPRSLPF
jgi:hypothetical protein